MQKLKALLIIFLLLPLNVIAINKENYNNLDDEGSHNCTREWWNIDAFIEADKNYSITASFEYERETPASNLFFTIFDLDEKKMYDLGIYNALFNELKCEENELNLSFKNSWMRGKYPSYIAHLENKNVIVEINIEAEEIPHFVAENSGGILPVGLGYYKYLFIPRCRAWGWLQIDGERKEFEGVAYYEHVWGNWSYNNPLKDASIDVFSSYVKLLQWWWGNKNISFDTITFSSDNPFSYDWTWASFDNGWNIFYGALPFWLNEIPFGILYLFNGNETIEFGKIRYEYVDGIFVEGACIPTKIKVRGEGKGELLLFMEMNNTPHIYKDDLSSFYWKKLILYECPGKIYGWYEDGNGDKTYLTGKCEIEIERQISIFDYFMLKLVPHFPSPLGIDFLFISYLLNIVLQLQINLFPFSFSFSFSHIK